jgi:WD40 repeat protein
MTEGWVEGETVSTGGPVGGPAAPGAVPPGATVGGYVVEELAGVGGMGVVYRASDPGLGRAVALKLIAPRFAEDPARRELFVRESLAAAGLEHPNVIPVYRAGEDGGRLFIAMRFVEGASLQELIRASGGLSAGRAARIVARVGEALDAAHARGLVHRDVKPANILVADPDGEEHVYLTDFGVSIHRTGSAGGGGGGWTGTRDYLAPEQIRGGALDGRTDVYALGCTLFHALTGRAPFAGDEDATLIAHLTQPPPAPSSLAPGLPPAMDAVVRRAMAKRPEDRFATAGELGRAALAARHDAAVLHDPADADAAQAVAAALVEAGVEPTLAPGGTAAAGEAVRASGACAVLAGPGALGPWAEEGLAAAADLAGRDRAFRRVLVLLPGAPDADDPRLAALAGASWIDLRAGVSDPLAIEDLARLLGAGREVAAGAPADECPYRGLEAFREDDAGVFFGRERDSARLLERLASSRFVAVVGPSGAGKSSLVHAGLVPALRRGEGPGGGPWRILSLSPGAHPLAALAAALDRLPGSGSPPAEALGADPGALGAAMRRACAGRPDGEMVLIVVDQLEEAFTLCADAAERAAALDALEAAATEDGGRAVVVATLRADFYGRLTEHPGIATLVAGSQLIVGPIDEAGLRRAIQEPARAAGLELEPGLVRRIIADVGDRPGALPLMEHLLAELWRRRRGRTLTLEAYAASGGVEGALARRANEVYGSMDPARRALARRVLLRLTAPGEGTEDTRRRATRRELATGPGDAAEVGAVVAALAEARLVTTGTDDATGEPVVEVTHEALIRGWPELRGWIDDDRERLREQRRLADAAAEWRRAGSDEGLLYRGARLAAWAERGREGLNPDETAFLDASAAAERAERDARRRRVRVAIGALAAAVVLVGAIAAYAFVQRDDAADQRDVAESGRLAANARLQLAPDPELAALLADAAYDTAPTPDAEEVLRAAVAESAVRESLDQGGPAWDVAVSGDGRTVATAGSDGVVRVWRPDTGDPPVAIPGHDGEVRGVAISPDGATVASAGADGTVRLRTLTGGRERVLSGHEGTVNSVAFRADGRAVVTAGDDGTVRLWTLPAGTARVLRGTEGRALKAAFLPGGGIVSGGDDGVVRRWDRSGAPASPIGAPHDGPVFGVATAPDGRVASASADLTARIAAPTGGAPVEVEASAFSGVDEVAFDPTGGRVATAGQDGSVRVWDAASGDALAVLNGHDGEVLAVRFAAGGDRVVSTGFDGTVRVWDWRQGLPAADIAAPGVLIFNGSASFAADGRVLMGLLDGSVRAWSPPDPSVAVVAPPGPAGTVGIALAVSPDGTRAATAGADGAIVVRTLGDDDAVTMTGHEGPVWAMAFTPDGASLVSGGNDGTVRVWDTATGEGREVDRHEGPVQAVAVSADGGRIASGDVVGLVRIRPVEGSGAPEDLTGHEGVVFDLGFSPDGTALASGGSDRTVRVWDLADGTSRVLGRHDTAVFTARWSADGSRLLSVASDGPRIWDPAQGIVLFAPDDPSLSSQRGALSPDGASVVVGRFDDTVRVYACETCGPVEEVRDLVGDRTTRELTAEEQETFGP